MDGSKRTGRGIPPIRLTARPVKESAKYLGSVAKDWARGARGKDRFERWPRWSLSAGICWHVPVFIGTSGLGA